MLQQLNSNLPFDECAFTLHSDHVDDDFFIRVALPASYSSSDMSYPVLYVPDGDYSFGLTASFMAYVNLGANFGMGKGIPEMIVVGIGYNRGVIPWLLTRVRDFTPTEDSTFNYDNPNFQVPESGKADVFLDMIQTELKPLLQAEYRVDDSLSVLATHSMGGVFALHTMLRAEPLFDKYILASPFVGWDSKVMFQREQSFSCDHSALPVEAFFSVTGREPTPPYREEVQDFCNILSGREYEGFQFKLQTYEEENHFSEWNKVFTDGMEYLFR